MFCRDFTRKGESDGLQEEVGEWGKVTFPEATDRTIKLHLAREVDELFTAPDQPALAEEIADCYLILLHLCHRNGVNLEEQAQRKFEICKTREWGEPDAQGVREHVRGI